MTAVLRRSGYAVNRKRVMRLMQQMGLAAIYPKPVLSHADPDHRVYPYLLRGVPVTGPDHLWSTDITLHPAEPGVRLPGGDFGLVQPQGAGVATLQHPGDSVLPRLPG